VNISFWGTISVISVILGIVGYLESKKKVFVKIYRYTKKKTKLLKKNIYGKKNSGCKVDFDPFEDGLPEGIVGREKLKKKAMITEDEDIAIELLTKQIVVKKQSNGNVDVFIDRGNVKYAAISNKGKRNLNKSIILPEKIQSLVEEDREIQSFLNNDSIDEKIVIELDKDKKMLRWASGGVLPIIEYEDENWIPMFYRDIEPHGWNIFLGSSERYFDDNNKLVGSIDVELNHPTNFIAREFLEEILIFKEEPTSDKEENIIRPLALPFDAQSDINKFDKEHIMLRMEYDGLNIKSDEQYINCESLKTNMTLHIISPNGEIINRTSNVLVCFNLLELGIEVVKVIKFKLDNGNILLDGELLPYIDKNDMKKKELVRMPVALVSCKFLEQHFKGDFSNIVTYDAIKDNASVKLKEFKTDDYSKDFILFDYDLKQRLRVTRNQKDKVGEKEKERYIKSFERFFEEINLSMNEVNINSTNAGIRKDYVKHFTPATAKLLNLFFNQLDKTNNKNI